VFSLPRRRLRCGSAAFPNEPQVKVEMLSLQGGARTVRLLERKGASVMARGETGRPV
jgi:hypothetical protein